MKPPGASEDGIESDEELQEMWTEEDFIAAVLSHPSLSLSSAAETEPVAPLPCAAKNKACADALAAQALEKEIQANPMKIFTSKGTRNLVWAQWVQPGQTVTAGLKYRTIWPEEKKQ